MRKLPSAVRDPDTGLEPPSLSLGPLAFLLFAVSGVSRGEKNKKCPHCAEWIKAEAKVCKHCGRDVVAPVVS